MNLEPFTGPGSTPTRRALWDKVRHAVTSARKTEGKNTSVTEYEGQGTLVAFKRDRGGEPRGACCRGTTCTFETQASCEADGGVYQGDNTDCDPNPCSEPTCTCDVTPTPQHVSGTITLNCDCEVFCGVTTHIELVDDDLTGSGCQCSVSFGYTFECDEACTPCFLDGSITVEYDHDAEEWLLIVTYGYSNSASVVLCSFSVQFPFDFSGGGPVTIDEDVVNGVPSSDCISHIDITIT